MTEQELAIGAILSAELFGYRIRILLENNDIDVRKMLTLFAEPDTQRVIASYH
jgi:hypothetical protein